MGGARAGAGLFVALAVGVAIAACSPNDPPGGDGSVVLLYLEPLWIGAGLAALGHSLVLQLALPRRTAPA